MLVTLRVSYAHGGNADEIPSISDIDETLNSIVGEQMFTNGWVPCCAGKVWECHWTDIEIAKAVHVLEVVSKMSLIRSAEIVYSAGDAEQRLVEKAIRMALETADQPVSIEDYEPGKDDPPSDQFPGE